MNNDKEYLKHVLTEAFTASLIRFSVIGILVIVCWWAFTPFLPILLWALVLAIALYPVRKLLDAKLGWSSKRSSIFIVLIGVLILGTPSVMVSNSIAGKTYEVFEDYNNGTLVIPSPKQDVKTWPIVGENVYQVWNEASKDLHNFIDKREPQIKGYVNSVLEAVGGLVKSVFLLIGAIIIAGIMLAWAEEAEKSIRRIFVSFSDEKKGPELHELTTATIRQVAVGIIGIAFLTAVIFGITVALAGIPAAALFTLVALIFAIMQLPVTIIAIVAIGILWSNGDSSVVHNAIFSVLIIAASLVDNFLKPMILGRGLDVPMPVVLIGAIGGMMSGGILGMFIGAAFLTASYQVFMKWVDTENEKAETKTLTADDDVPR